MKHVIYRTEYYNRNEIFCFKEYEYDAYFNTIDDDESQDIDAHVPEGCMLLEVHHVQSRLTKEQWDNLASKKPGYTLRYASLYDIDENQYAIYAVYERMIADENAGEVYSANVSFGADSDDVMIDMDVIPTDYDLDGTHITRWDEVAFEGTTRFFTDNGIAIKSSTDPLEARKVIIHHNGWTIMGKWERMEHPSPYIFVYYCRNSLFSFNVTFNIERYPWNGDYKSLLQ